MSDAVEATPKLPDDVGALKALISARDVRIAVLEEQLRLAIHKRFGSSSETFDPDQLGLFNGAEASAPEELEPSAADITVPEHTRKKSGRQPLAATCRACGSSTCIVVNSDPITHPHKYRNPMSTAKVIVGGCLSTDFLWGLF